MKKFKGTPGPWYAVDYAGYKHLQSAPDYSLTDDLLDSDVCDVADHNVTLAAASPELLEALQLAVAHIPIGRKEFAICQAAINKALGE